MISLLALIKTYIVGTQKNRLTEKILLSTHTIGFEGWTNILEHEKRSLSRALHYELYHMKTYLWGFVTSIDSDQSAQSALGLSCSQAF